MSTPLQRPVIGYTLGDQAGIGPEIMRAALQALLTRLPDGCRPVLTADAFACVPAQTLWTDRDGVEHRVSCGYANPLLAFEAGVTHGEEVLRHAAF